LFVVLGMFCPLLSVAAPAMMFPLAQLNVLPWTTTLVGPRGTLEDGETIV
jgi:hypothetical protein